MDDCQQERFNNGLATALDLFSGSPELPSFPVPPEIEAEWNSFSIGVVMGEVWSRPQLAQRDRALVTIALLTATHKLEQLRTYVAVGINKGLSRSEICEAIFHTAVYAGFPCAVEGFRVASEVFARYDERATSTSQQEGST